MFRSSQSQKNIKSDGDSSYGEKKIEDTEDPTKTLNKTDISPVSTTPNARGVRQRHAKNLFFSASPSSSPSIASIQGTPTHRTSVSPGDTSRRRWQLCRPRKWTLASLLILILLISTVCSLVMSTVSLYWWWSSAMEDTRGIPQLRKTSSNRATVFSWWSSHPKDRVASSRVHYLVGVWDASAPLGQSYQVDETMMHSLRSYENDALDDWQPIDYTTSRCQPRAEWQTKSFPTCNNLHELQLHAALPEVFKKSMDLEEELTVLGEGWFRTTWRLDRRSYDKDVPTESLVLKTLRIEREYKREYYELHRRDAVAMERLTRSPFVVDVYGACGNSAINELANFPYEGVQSLEVFNRRLRGHDQTPQAYLMKLKMATSVAVGLADVHGIDSDTVPTLAHYDINPRNVALFEGGKPKLNDFNIAEFLHYDPETNETCGFPARLHEPWWRAPEEMNVTTNDILVDEKVDVYALGNILFHTLTTHSPRGKMKPERLKEVRAIVAAGTPPVIPPPYDKTTDPAAVAIRHAIKLCFRADPKERATAAEIAHYLKKILFQLTKEEHSAAARNVVSPPHVTADEASGEDESRIEAKG
ncbi:hypothetical protein FisN_11Hh169 [Fistulifera solaris]|uniref:Protein kinase domain-containing protein n=1 Tax=Fistulifera solaris TaxID=1519565 RepID=A0A1Z5JK71_FISSO|nr:hypothetical protein FisN_11Hh169 [Fistulifera solaris]|eukprot:GAX14374.1 hypothetical protein FisN_11Hh169 [Fistulifera solaris]